MALIVRAWLLLQVVADICVLERISSATGAAYAVLLTFDLLDLHCWECPSQLVWPCFLMTSAVFHLQQFRVTLTLDKAADRVKYFRTVNG